MSEKKVPLLMRPHFLSFFDMMINGQARALPSFSHGPHSKQENVSNKLQFLNIRGKRLHLCALYSSVGPFLSSC